MPERDVILARARALKGHVWALEPEGEETKWTGKEHGTTFELSKPEGVVFDDQKDISHLFLVLKGKVKGKEQLKKDFIVALGKPLSDWPAKRFCRPQLLFWDTAKALQPQQPK